MHTLIHGAIAWCFCSGTENLAYNLEINRKYDNLQEPVCSGVLHTILSNILLKDIKSPKVNDRLLCFKKGLPKVLMLKK